ncbi:MAG: sulfotransferase [Pseudomonadota bacterium]
MRWPNLLLVGVQKSGTTWMHRTLSQSRHIFGSTPKELNLWGKPDYLYRLNDYRAKFPAEAKPGALYFLESTPHYFHAPSPLADIAQQIRDTLPEVRILVILRNPVDRYRSAYTHHIQMGRLPYTAEIDEVTDAQIMLSTGLYGKILSHWQKVFPGIIVYPYDRLEADPAELLSDLFARLDLDCDLDLAGLDPPVHTSEQKRRRLGWPVVPRLSARARAALIAHYRADIMHLDSLVDFDATAWLADERPG